MQMQMQVAHEMTLMSVTLKKLLLLSIFCFSAMAFFLLFSVNASDVMNNMKSFPWTKKKRQQQHVTECSKQFLIYGLRRGFMWAAKKRKLIFELKVWSMPAKQ